MFVITAKAPETNKEIEVRRPGGKALQCVMDLLEELEYKSVMATHEDFFSRDANGKIIIV